MSWCHAMLGLCSVMPHPHRKRPKLVFLYDLWSNVVVSRYCCSPFETKRQTNSLTPNFVTISTPGYLPSTHTLIKLYLNSQLLAVAQVITAMTLADSYSWCILMFFIGCIIPLICVWTAVKRAPDQSDSRHTVQHWWGVWKQNVSGYRSCLATLTAIYILRDYELTTTRLTTLFGCDQTDVEFNCHYFFLVSYRCGIPKPYTTVNVILSLSHFITIIFRYC